MTNPMTELDGRFSAPDTEPTDWTTTEAILEAAQLSWITTVRADGRPHVTPLVSVWLDGIAHFTTGPDEQKALNLRHNPAVVLTTGCNAWNRGLDVMIEGTATRITDQPLLERLAAAWATKWDGQWQYEPVNEGFHHSAGLALVFGVQPAKILTFGKNPFTHTRHRFQA